jgi:ATP-binding cassette subfamily B protein
VKELGRALGYLKEYWLVTLGAFVSLLIVTGVNLIIPRLLQQVIDQGIADRDMQRLMALAAIMVGVTVVKAVFQFLQGFWSAKASQGVAYDMRNELYSKIQNLSFSYHDRAQTGQLMTRATNDVDAVRMFTGMAFLRFISSLVMLIGALVILFSINARLAWVPLAVIPATLVMVGIFAAKGRPLFREVQKKLATLNTVLQENLAGARVVKAFAREPFERQRYEEKNEDLYDQSVAVGKIVALIFPTVFLFTNLGTLGITWIGGYQVINDQLSLGELVAFSSYLMMITWPVIALGMITSMISRAGASAERIFEILDTESEVKESPDAEPLPAIQGHVMFADVSFRYFQGGQDVLKDISFEAQPGQTIALLGATGSGKSTIINLIPRFYDVTEGRILVDGRDVREITLESLRSQVGIVLQETTLFTGTIRENIAFGRPDASDQAVIEAAKAAAAHDFITSFPDGYETAVGERGVTLSGGQKQRVAIARALLTDPRILILDDSTSNVDLQTEYRIQQALDRLMEGRTSFVIAQRISTVLNADQILVLEGGRVAARGQHEKLLEESPIYADIYYSQLQPEAELTDLPEMTGAGSDASSSAP